MSFFTGLDTGIATCEGGTVPIEGKSPGSEVELWPGNGAAGGNGAKVGRVCSGGKVGRVGNVGNVGNIGRVCCRVVWVFIVVVANILLNVELKVELKVVTAINGVVLKVVVVLNGVVLNEVMASVVVTFWHFPLENKITKMTNNIVLVDKKTSRLH